MTAAALVAIIILWAASDVVVAGLGCIIRAWWAYAWPQPSLADRIAPQVLSDLDVRCGVVA